MMHQCTCTYIWKWHLRCMYVPSNVHNFVLTWLCHYTFTFQQGILIHNYVYTCTCRCTHCVIVIILYLPIFFCDTQSPTFKRDGDTEVPEPFAEMAKFFTESRLLQQDVKLLIEGVSNQLVMATVIHPVSYCFNVTMEVLLVFSYNTRE